MQIEQEDLLELLAHSHTHFANLSKSVQTQIESISQGLLIYPLFSHCHWIRLDLGSVICLFQIKQHDLEIPIIFVSWRGRSSLRPFVSHSSRKFYFSLCNIDQATISK